MIGVLIVRFSDIQDGIVDVSKDNFILILIFLNRCNYRSRLVVVYFWVASCGFESSRNRVFPAKVVKAQKNRFDGTLGKLRMSVCEG